jgi:pyruvate,water dikinase
VLDLGSVVDLDPEKVGSKALRLAQLKRDGFLVAPGFVVTERAFVGERLSREGGEEAEQFRKELGKTSLVVRSSAPGEDAAQASHAGVYESFLDVEGGPGLRAAIERCRRSGSSESARGYRRERTGEEEEKLKIAVLVQEMVRPDVSGVLFTADPSGRKGRRVIEAVRGHSGELLSGATDPERYVLRASDGYLLERESPVADSLELLSDSNLAELHRLSGKLEDRFGCPQDIEWALVSGKFFVFQCRPITTCPAAPVVRELWTGANAQEALPGMVSPLTWSLLPPLVERGRKALFGVLKIDADADARYLRLYRGRAYFNVLYFRRFLEENFHLLGPDVFDRLIFGEEGLPVRALEREKSRGVFRWLEAARFCFRVGRLVLPRVVTAQGALEKGIDRFRQRLAIWTRHPPAELSDNQLIENLNGLLESVYRGFLDHVFGTAMAGGYYELLGKALRRWMGPDGDRLRGEMTLAAHGALSGAEMIAFEGLVRLARSDARLREVAHSRKVDRLRAEIDSRPREDPFRVLYRRFLSVYGHRTVMEADLSRPRWSEDDTFLLEALTESLQREVPVVDVDREQRLIKARRQACAQVRCQLRGVRWFLVRHLYGQSLRYLPYRENVKFHVMKGMASIRYVLLEIGRRLAERGQIENSGDIFQMRADEFEEALLSGGEAKRWRAVVAQRLEESAKQDLDRPPLLFAVDLEGNEVELPAGPGAQVFRGVGVSPGIVRGRARLVQELGRGARIEEGDILVARAVDVSCLPLFLLARGVALEVGGQLSHTAIVAREFGIPMVTGVSGLTERIVDGDEIVVDGDSGLVRFVSN